MSMSLMNTSVMDKVLLSPVSLRKPLRPPRFNKVPPGQNRTGRTLLDNHPLLADAWVPYCSCRVSSIRLFLRSQCERTWRWAGTGMDVVAGPETGPTDSPPFPLSIPMTTETEKMLVMPFFKSDNSLLCVCFPPVMDTHLICSELHLLHLDPLFLLCFSLKNSF